MRLTRPSRSFRLGMVHVTEEIRVLELDARGPSHHSHDHDYDPLTAPPSRATRGSQRESEKSETVCFSREVLDGILSQMVIIVPCKNEEVEVLRAVISAIPASCLVIVVSNCERRRGDDRYLRQLDMLKTFGRCSRQIFAVHQKDIGAAVALGASGMPELLNPSDGTVRNGKGEGMLLGVAIAAAFCHRRRYVGFVDADNFCAGSVNEYCRAFAAGFALSRSPEQEYAMVRLRWSSKPKMRDGNVDFVSEGRCSRIVNTWLNKLLVPLAEECHATREGLAAAGTEKHFVTTGNAGEHAMTMDLALKLRMAAGYAIEPFHYIDLLERGHLLSPAGPRPAAKQDGMVNGTHTPGSIKHISGHTSNGTAKFPRPLQKPVRILQIRTLNPHFHRASDATHIRRMWAAGLGAIYHHLSRYVRLASPDAAFTDAISKLRMDMHTFAVKNRGIDDRTGELPRPRVYRALEEADLDMFREVLQNSYGSLRSFGFSS
ncbi:hypothetical protein VTK56DRAFT_6714 [Thermocarpiscus australiensis]